MAYERDVTLHISIGGILTDRKACLYLCFRPREQTLNVLMRLTLERLLAVQIVSGLDEGITSMKVGGLRRLYIPGNLSFPKGLPSGPGRYVLCLSPFHLDGATQRL